MDKLTNLIQATRNEKLKVSSNTKLLEQLTRDGVITNVVIKGGDKFVDCGELVKVNGNLYAFGCR